MKTFQIYKKILLKLLVCLFTLFELTLCLPPDIPDKNPVVLKSENTPVGSILASLVARDQDLGDSITFKIGTDETEKIVDLSTAYQSNISTNEWKADVTLKSKLDSDNKPKVINLYFEVSDSPNSRSSTINMILIVTDFNDNPPRFVNLPYRASAREDLPLDSVIFTVKAEDIDEAEGRVIQYSIQPNNMADEDLYNRMFDINKDNGEISLIETLDFETRSFYHFKVFAKDSGNPQCPGPQCVCDGDDPDFCSTGDVVDLFLTVVDVQDTPPQFDRLPYIASVAEDVQIGFSILQIQSRDGDRSVSQENKHFINFSIDGDSSELPFSVNASDGTVYVSQALNADDPILRTKGGLYVFTVTAKEESNNPNDVSVNDLNLSSSSTQVSVTVTDVNDNTPVFNSDQFRLTVLENTPNGVPLTLTFPQGSTIDVKDIDLGLNSQFQLSTRHTGDVIFTTLPAQDQAIIGQTSVTIVVANSSLIDFEQDKQINFTLLATETSNSGSNPAKSETLIIVDVLDTNDNNPKFLEQPTQFNVSEDTIPNTAIGAQITASDLDSGDYGIVTFSLEPGSPDEFDMTSDGQLIVVKELDREKRSSYSLVIIATDSPSELPESQRQSRLRITVSVTDVNDNDPQWTQVIPTVSVMENEEIGTSVTDLRASDLDDGENGQVTYSISPGTNGSAFFLVDETVDGRAEIRISNSLVDNSGQLLVRVLASDMGNPPKSASFDLTVVVLDVNLNSPVFKIPDETKFNADTAVLPEVVVDEELPIGSELIGLLATDSDDGENGRVWYYLLPSVNGDFESFRLNRVNGTLTADRRLNREEKDVYEIQVKAEDNGQPAPRSTVLTMKVKLKDINDNEPSYSDVTMPFKMFVEENEEAASLGMIPEAFDADLEPQFKIVCYYLLGGDSINNFELNKSTRELTTKEAFDYEKIQSLDLIVKASSNCDLDITEVDTTNTSSNTEVLAVPALYDRTNDELLWIQVNIIDKNDNPPVFTQKELSAGIIFDSEIGTKVLDLKPSVFDKDTKSNSIHSYTLLKISATEGVSDKLTSSKDAFVVTSNGTILTNIRYQSDMVGHFDLSVMVKDKDGLEDTASVRVFLISNLERMKLVFNKVPMEVELLKNNFVNELSNIMGFELVIDTIIQHTRADGSKDAAKTDAFIHGRYTDTGKVVPAKELFRAFDLNEDVRAVLYKYGITEADTLTKKEEESEDETLRRILVILIAVLGVIVLALLIVLIHMVRMYRRRLRAATTMAFASPKLQEMYEHPGTNKYFAAENPLFGKEIKQAVLDEDRTSEDSLDMNAVDQPRSKIDPELDPEEEQELVLQINDIDMTPEKIEDLKHNKNLDTVLQEYENSGYEPDSYESSYTGHSQKLMFSPDVDLIPENTGNFVPGINEAVQEAVTRFSEENLSGDSGFSHTLGNTQQDLQYTDI